MSEKNFLVILCFLSLTVSVIFAQDISTAWEYFLKGKYNIADRIVNSLLEEKATSPDLYYLKALILCRTGDFVRARNYLEKLNFYGAEWAKCALVARGDSFFQEGKLKQAKEIYHTFLKRYPYSNYTPEVIYKYAQILRKEGRWKEAKAYLRQVTNDYPQSLFATFARKLLAEDEFYFCVQVGSFLNYDNAYNLAVKIKKAGYPAYIKKVEYRGQLYYRVRIGKYPDRESVEEVFKQLVKKGFHGLIYP